MKLTLKNLTRTMVFGALIGGSLATWLAPKWIAWYFNPPVPMGIDCTKPINWALQKLQWAQLAGIGIGALLSFVILVLLARRFKDDELPPDQAIF